jgi:hypothetical protein
VSALVVIAMNAFAGLAGTLSHVSIDWPLTGAVTAAALFGSILGTRFEGRIRENLLRQAFGWFVIVIGGLALAQQLPADVRTDWRFWVATTVITVIGIAAALASRSRWRPVRGATRPAHVPRPRYQPRPRVGRVLSASVVWMPRRGRPACGGRRGGSRTGEPPEEGRSGLVGSLHLRNVADVGHHFERPPRADGPSGRSYGHQWILLAVEKEDWLLYRAHGRLVACGTDQYPQGAVKGVQEIGLGARIGKALFRQLYGVLNKVGRHPRGFDAAHLQG